jgi:hypothetical protein
VTTWLVVSTETLGFDSLKGLAGPE